MAPSQALACLSANRPGDAGFSLPELLVTVAVTGVLTGIAVPPMSAMLQAQRATALANSFIGSLHLARNEAIKRNGRAVLCKSATGLSCTLEGGWEQGWIVFHDLNNNALLDAGEWVVKQHTGGAARMRLAGNQPVRSYVSYSASGTAKLMSGAFQAGTFTLCPEVHSGVPVRKIILSGTGRPRIYPGTAADCGG